MIDPEARIEAQLDTLVDQGNSYDDARRMLGIEAPDTADFTADAITARHPELAFTNDANPKNGLNQAAWKESFVKQREINEAGLKAARLALHPPQEQ